ncbi:hypothetical protein AVEN_193857-1 [Araneus ventricosus]|uniref:Uncharacterized protein n=1 Tax=Araneus ventricosus TaxID=182803 RepID=A0A4Y2PDY3_ARAVE|nr:hypothetical protein AVEN_149159-1 [Araneus ventricosus]GBN49411.1 hypothetical protein AVEN_193857-1 [Araneus ventricosus]
MVCVSEILVRVMPYHPSWDRKESFCLKVCEVVRSFRGNVRKCFEIKETESTDGDISTVSTGCCRLCMRRGNNASVRIQTGNKSPTMQVYRLKTDHGNRALRERREKMSDMLRSGHPSVSD